MTRIALLPSSYPPSLGGVEELTRHLALALAGEGDQVEVWTGTGDDHAPESVEVRDGLVVRRLPMPLPAANLAGGLSVDHHREADTPLAAAGGQRLPARCPPRPVLRARTARTRLPSRGPAASPW